MAKKSGKWDQLGVLGDEAGRQTGRKKVPSPTGRPSPVRSEVRAFDRNPAEATRGGKRPAAAPKPKPKKGPGVSVTQAASRLGGRGRQIDQQVEAMSGGMRKKRKGY
jgi:hypothetical protein